MAERQIAGNKLPLWRGTGTGSPETFELMACLTSLSINQGSNTISTPTFCGVLKGSGDNAVSINFDIVPLFDAASGKVGFDDLQADYKAHTIHNWRVTTATNVSGDPIMTFTGFISEMNWKMTADGTPMSGTGTLEVNDNGITTTLAV